jgi:hypothetical protein
MDEQKALGVLDRLEACSVRLAELAMHEGVGSKPR